MRIGAIGGLGTVALQEGLDVVADEDARVQQGQLAVECRFVVDRIEEALGEGCGAQGVEGAAGA